MMVTCSLCCKQAPNLGRTACDLLLRTIVTAALLSSFLVHKLFQEELPQWASTLLLVLLPPLSLVLSISSTLLLIQLVHLLLPPLPPLVNLVIFLAVNIALSLIFAPAHWLLWATLLLLVIGLYVIVLERCVAATSSPTTTTTTITTTRK